MLLKLTPVVNFINILTAAILCQYTFAKKLQSQTVTREKLGKTLSYALKIFVKLTPEHGSDPSCLGCKLAELSPCAQKTFWKKLN